HSRCLLKDLSFSLADTASLVFYTDGSLLHCNSSNVHIGFAWLLTNLSEPTQFLATSSGWLSSFKAESLAILTALLICPHHANVIINTDSASAIQMYNQIFNYHSFLNKRTILKQS